MTINIATPKSSVVKVTGADGKTHSVRMDWNPSFGQEFTDTFQRGQAMFDIEVLRLTEKYVPKLTNMLRTSARIATVIGNGKLTWNTPYAAAQYYRKKGSGGTTLGGPLAGPRWGDRAKADNLAHLRAFAKGVFQRGGK